MNSATSAIAAAEHGMAITRALSYQVQAVIVVLPGLAQKKIPVLPVHVVYAASRRGSINASKFTVALKLRLERAPGVERTG
jgi:hypothetical protein